MEYFLLFPLPNSCAARRLKSILSATCRLLFVSFCVAGVLDLQLSTCSFGFVYIAVSVCGLVSPRNLFFHPTVPASIYAIPPWRYVRMLGMDASRRFECSSVTRRRRIVPVPQQIILLWVSRSCRSNPHAAFAPPPTHHRCSYNGTESSRFLTVIRLP